MGDVRIELLQVHFDVVGDGEEEFVRLFERYINRWSQMQTERIKRERAYEMERCVGDRHHRDEG